MRDEELLLDSVYTNLLHISTVIRKTEEPDGELVDAFDSLQQHISQGLTNWRKERMAEKETVRDDYQLDRKNVRSLEEGRGRTPCTRRDQSGAA